MAKETLTIISLNAWAGRALYPLMRFIQRVAPTTDVFCLQEVFDSDRATQDKRHPNEFVQADLYKMLCAELKGFTPGFARHPDDPHRMSSAMFVSHRINFLYGIDDVGIHTPERPIETGSAVISARRMQHATVWLNNRPVQIANCHGLWQPGPKSDTPERLLQSHKIRAALDPTVVLCGDFNLLPETESLRILSENMRDLVKENGVTCTRTPHYRHFDNPAEPNFADYVFTSPDLEVHEFAVLPDLASDHAPLRVVVS
jgi:endonuclease/exonuclease/phosphatase family metal-dependent hydrolase